MNIVFIINDKFNRYKKIQPRLQKKCIKYGMDQVSFLKTEHKKHAVTLAIQSVKQGCQYLIAVGGDGTLNEIVNGMLQVGLPEKEQPVIGLLPNGSANDFARSAQLPHRLDAFFELLKKGTTTSVDLGRVHLINSNKTHYFLNILGLGLGPEIAQQINESSSIFGPYFNYFKNIIKGFHAYSKKEVSCETETWKWQGSLLQMAIAKGRFFASGLCVAPQSKLNNGTFQVVIIGDLSLMDYFLNLWNLKKGSRIKHPEVHYYDSKKLFLKSHENKCGIEADGEYIGNTPARVEVLAQKLDFLMR